MVRTKVKGTGVMNRQHPSSSSKLNSQPNDAMLDSPDFYSMPPVEPSNVKSDGQAEDNPYEKMSRGIGIFSDVISPGSAGEKKLLSMEPLSVHSNVERRAKPVVKPRRVSICCSGSHAPDAVTSGLFSRSEMQNSAPEYHSSGRPLVRRDRYGNGYYGRDPSGTGALNVDTLNIQPLPFLEKVEDPPGVDEFALFVDSLIQDPF